jgi:sigma-B regulation protein RsbU (phosphoserine phosphatase)
MLEPRLGVRLKVTTSEGTRTVTVDQPTFSIGRRNAAHLYLSSGDVSRWHADIVDDGGRYKLKDVGSRYGTFVNGREVVEHTLTDGDHIRLGRSGAVELVFETGDGTISTVKESTSDVTDLRQMAAIMDVLRVLGSGQILDDVLTHVIDSALKLTKAERGFIMLANPAGQLEFKTARERGVGLPPGTSFATSLKIPREVFETGKRRVITNLSDDPGHEATMVAGIRQVICTPLRAMPTQIAGGRPIGVLYLDGRFPSAKRSSAMLDSLDAIATHAAIAIESARLYAEAEEKARIDRDLRMAAVIQQSLQADPLYAGPICDLAAVSLPCRTIGGDFFDYLELSDGCLTFALGDVAGKGPPAAVLAAALQSNFVAHASVGNDPAQTTASINAALLRRPIEARFATMFHGVLHANGQLSYCNAGHEPPLVVGPEGVRWLEVGGPVLGLFRVAQYEWDTVHLSANDLVVICSDGVTEATNRSGEEFGRTRIAEIVSTCSTQKPEAVLDVLLGAVRAFTQGAAQADDLTAMILRYRPKPSPV